MEIDIKGQGEVKDAASADSATSDTASAETATAETDPPLKLPLTSLSGSH